MADFLARHGANRVEPELGGHGVVAHFGDSPGPSLLFRAELDALPIEESLAIEHASAHPGVSHKCGHDGHMTIACGLGLLLARHPPTRGRMTLLFQPAEETGTGAAAVLADPRWNDEWGSDGRYAFHNLPGHALGEVSVRAGPMNFASVGLRVELLGKTSHAAEPEHAISPRAAVAKLLHELPELGAGRDDRLLTVVHARIGHLAFGVTPGEAELGVTLRAETDAALAELRSRVERAVHEASEREGLACQIELHDPFPATINTPDAVERVRVASTAAGLSCPPLPRPMRWSEDFGAFLHTAPGALIGLGSGLQQPALHRPEYDFPDLLLEPGLRLAWNLMQSHWE